MSDFLLDLRPFAERDSLARAAAFLKFRPRTTIHRISHSAFDLILASVDNPRLWGPYQSDDLIVALCGRIALSEAQWTSAEGIPGPGGRAAKVIAKEYRESGTSALTGLNGNFALVLFDEAKQIVFLVSDPAGAVPVYRCSRPGALAFGSHPDALAIAVGEDQNWDETSLAEFALGGVVTPPFSHYQNIQSIPEGTLITLRQRESLEISEQSYFRLSYHGDEYATNELELAEELAAALKSAVRKRSLPILGLTAVALSGGMDSRTILAATGDRSHLMAFCCFDEENLEFRIAREIARAAGVKLIPLVRSFDFYADNAELGVRISGGMGTFANNHFLGIADRLEDLGVENLLTGCYCDYLFKGLVLNRRTRGLLGREELGQYRDEYYFSHYRLLPPWEAKVRARWSQRFPESLRKSRADADVFKLERLRTFPLHHEGDNAQRLVPQRVLYNYLPFADRELLNVYCKIPYRFKLNRSIFNKAAGRICGPSLNRIPDANTGAPVNASLLRETITSGILRFKRKLGRLYPKIAMETSWPDWEYYVPNSVKLRDLWRKTDPGAKDFFQRVLLPEDLRGDPADYTGNEVFLFVQLLTLKLWFEQRSRRTW